MKKFFVFAVVALLLGLSGAALAADEPLVINQEKHEIIMQAEVNGKYFDSPTRHGVVYLTGSNGEKSVLRGLTSEKTFHDALLKIGATPGNNVTLDDMKAGPTGGATPAGSKLNVFVTWAGAEREYPFTDIIKASEERPDDYHFGGNLPAANKANTGCVLCLDSCAVGITSNASYPTGTTQNNVVEFYGDSKVLPPDGTRVSVIFRLAE
ncbi:hypothetical protein AGMMS49957_05000 [Synergistales bacterium]|nr:hypothetical protein AGMMS49957_05000 [Synergistales bacterium]